MFISQTYYCYQIHKEKTSNSEIEKSSNSITNQEEKPSYNFFKKFAWS